MSSLCLDGGGRRLNEGIRGVHRLGGNRRTGERRPRCTHSRLPRERDVLSVVVARLVVVVVVARLAVAIARLVVVVVAAVARVSFPLPLLPRRYRDHGVRRVVLHRRVRTALVRVHGGQQGMAVLVVPVERAHTGSRAVRRRGLRVRHGIRDVAPAASWSTRGPIVVREKKITSHVSVPLTRCPRVATLIGRHAGCNNGLRPSYRFGFSVGKFNRHGFRGETKS